MKNFYCFYCQQDVKPRGLWKIRFCPKCKHFMTDDGEGFYKVCDVCGANLPANAKKCLRCNHIFAMEEAMEQYGFHQYVFENSWIGWLLAVVLLFVSVVAALGILYVLFYFVAAVILVALVVLLFNMLRAWLHI